LAGGSDLADGVEYGATTLARGVLGVAEALVTRTCSHVEDPAIPRIDEEVDVAPESLGHGGEEAAFAGDVVAIGQSG
jgi:hypothetical protein